MSYTQADLDKIRACIAAGVLETRFADGRSTKFQSLGELLDAETKIAAAVAASTGRKRRTYPAYRNGC